MRLMLDQARSSREATNALVHLTPRELEVLRMISLGLTNAEVAERLGVTIHAVKFHLAAVYRLLDVANRTEAAVRYLRESQADGAGPDRPVEVRT
jgi:DNA-binding CsgD family transcriptional regulator